MPEQIQKRLIEEEMKKSYIDYSMSVIMSRALPDVHDGLKPVHRRILYTMYKLGLMSTKPFRKSSTIIGNTMSNFHPHGDLAIYDSLARMAQDFALRYPLVQGQGNWGSIDGDAPAAHRYTEARLSKFAEEMLVDIEKETVKFLPNFDNTQKEPIVLPGKFPNLLVNGSSGIAVGMATNMPSHNLREVCDAIVAQIDKPEIEIDELMQYIKGPDFPTGAYIVGKSGIVRAYKSGKGLLKLRAKTEIEEKGNKKRIIVNEIPYQVNKSSLIKNIADLVKEKVVAGITDLRDESDRTGMRIVIEIKQGANPELVLNQLYKHSQLQTTFGVNMLALIAGQPKVLSLKGMVKQYINHRKRVVTRRTAFELKKSEERAHILEGLKIALTNIDEVVKLIKASDSVEAARKGLIKTFKLTEIQSNAILDMKLQKLTSLETKKIKEEYDKLIKLISELKGILADEAKIFSIIKKEVLEIKEKYGDDRRTEILDLDDEVVEEDLIKKEDVVITVTHSGYIKRLPIETYKQQRRGGKGIIATETREGDFVEDLFITSTHNYILFFTDKGRVHWLKAYRVPEAKRYSKGMNIINILNLKDEKVNASIPIKEFREDQFLVMVTKNGLVKKTKLSEYSNVRKSGIIALNLRDKDELVDVKLTFGTNQLIIGSKNGMAVKFNEENVRPMGRGATGVRGIRLISDEVVGMEIAPDKAALLTITENGYGKRSEISEYRLINRGGKGVINIKTTTRNGKVIGIKTVKDDDELMFITKKGILIRTNVKDIKTIGRNTQGVRLMKLDSGDKVISVARVISNGST